MKPIRYLVLSDIHLGHDKNPTENIVANLRTYFEDNHKIFKHLDIIFIAGDIFDKLLVNGSKAFLLALEWLTTLAMYCKHNNIKLRILEGTPGHDWRQASVLNTVLKETNLDLDFKYIDTLAIEKMEDLGLTILYVPDEYKHKASETYEDVKKLLEEEHLTQVDIAIMHGQFHYQLPMIVLESSHNENDYLDIVKYYISIGHIHIHSVNGRILAQGSFDRLTHNEEEDKGGMVITIDKEHNDMEYIFIPNKNSMIFKTLNYSGIDDDTVYKLLDEDIRKIKEHSYVRILVNKDSSLKKSKDAVKHKYPNYYIKIESKEKKDTKLDQDKLLDMPKIDSFQITPDNIRELMSDEMSKHNLTVNELKIFEEELSLVM